MARDTDEAIFDAGAYRAHFRQWWEEKGRAQREKDEDAMETIEKRLKEVTEMVTPRKSVETAMERMATPMREKVREFSTITSDTFKLIRSRQRKHRKAFLRFRYAICLVVILTRAFRMRKKYFNTRKKGRRSFGANGGGTNRSDTFATNLQTIRSANFKCSVALELQLHLSNLPEHRDERQIKKIIYYLRATKAFTMFSSEVEEDLARHIGYDCYDDGRIIAFQGRAPDRFYYVISGRIQLIRQYKLQTGVINKVMATLRKGSFTDTEELERQWVLQCNLVCKGMVEVLVLDKHDYFKLRNTILGPPIEFLRSLDLLKDFPLEIFHQHPEAIQYKYYSPDQLIAHDTNRTRDVFIVKSGSCRCVRKQWVTDISNDRRFYGKQGIGKLGYVKEASHADAMLGTSWKRMILNGQMNSVLPQIRKVDMSATGSVLNQHINTLDLNKQRNITDDRSSHWSSVTGLDDVTLSNGPIEAHGSEIGETISTLKQKPRCRPRLNRADSNTTSIDMPAITLLEPEFSATFRKSKDLRRSGLFMTQRSRTDLSLASRRPKCKGNHLEPIHDVQRIAYLQVDTLQKGDIFGLNDLLSDTSADRSGIAVWSEGAEIVAINKRFFKNNASIPTMLRVDMMIRDWMSEEDASDRIEAQDTWQEYKSVLMERMSEQKAKNALVKSLTSLYTVGS